MAPKRITCIALAIALFSSGCLGDGAGPAPRIEPTGPPRVRPAVVAAHASQFDDELPERPAGSQQEGAAAGYMLGHLQQAGYPARLDGVPVGNLVRSTNVIAVPPGGAEASVVVTVAYDTPRRGGAAAGAALGLFLELARALQVADPEHAVEFVALGGERAEASGGNLGSRRMATVLRQEGDEPFVVVLEPAPGDSGLRVRGPGSGELAAVANDAGNVVADDALAKGDATARVFRDAGFDVAVVSGEPALAGRVLLEYLLREASG